MIHIILTKDIITVEPPEADFLRDPSCGSVAWFAGVVRNHNEGQAVTGIDYECYENMAKKELMKIADEAKIQWEIPHLYIAHRIGYMAVGETSLIVGTTSPHRKESFEAMQYIINELKQRVPIWKKEFYASGHQEWVACHHVH
jgi:molybdopterin synthase catalytic subunit